MLSSNEIFLEEKEYNNDGRTRGIIVNNIENLKYFANKIKDNKDLSKLKKR